MPFPPFWEATKIMCAVNVESRQPDIAMSVLQLSQS